jgi:predicted MPP superfamily phosphohydrolase
MKLLRLHKLIKFILLKLIQILLVGITLLFLCSIYAHKIEPLWFEIKQISITLPQLDRSFRGYRIVQISDLHAGDKIDRTHLNKVIDAVNDQKPDLVVITGDHVSRMPRRHIELLDIYLRLHPRDRTVAVLGNHDVYNDATPIL